MTLKEGKEFEAVTDFQALYLQSLKGKTLELEDLLFHSLVGGMLEGGKIAPYGSQESDWEELDGGSLGLTRNERLTMHRQADKLLRAESLMVGIHKRFLMHICSQNQPTIGLVDLEGEKHPLTQRLQALIPDFPTLANQIVSYTLKFGELYALHLPVENSGLGRPRFELLAPHRCLKVHVETPYALESKPVTFNFPCLRKAVHMEGLKPGFIPAAAVTMFRIHHDLNDGLHGLSLYHVAMKEVTRYTDWLNTRGLRSRASAFFVVLRMLKGRPGGGKHELPERPMIVDVNEDYEKWVPLESSSSARDAAADGEELRVRAIQSSGLPEPEVSGNPRFAAQVKQGAATRLYEYYQRAFTGPLKELVAKTLGLPDTREVILSWPFVDPRERTARVTEGSTLARERIISRAAVHRRLGYDHELIEQELEAELAIEAAPPPGLDLPGMLPFAHPSEPGKMPGAPLSVAPVRPDAGPDKGASAAEASVIVKALPSGLLVGGQKIEVADDEIQVETTSPPVLVLGIDHGYSGNGAIVLGGLAENTITIVGEILLHRTPLEGGESWKSTLSELREKMPALENVFVGSDHPELVSLLKEIGFSVSALKPRQEEFDSALSAFREAGGTFSIDGRCKRLIAELRPEQADREAGSHIKTTQDFLDAFRYLFLGVIQAAPQKKEKREEHEG